MLSVKSNLATMSSRSIKPNYLTISSPNAGPSKKKYPTSNSTLTNSTDNSPTTNNAESSHSDSTYPHKRHHFSDSSNSKPNTIHNLEH